MSGVVAAVLSLAGFAVVTPAFGVLGPAWVRFPAGAGMQGFVALRLARRLVRPGFRTVASIPRPGS